MDIWFNVLIPVAFAIIFMVITFIAADWTLKNYKKPIFIILIIVIILHILFIAYVPWSVNLDSHILDVQLVPAEDTWADMLLDQDDGFTDDFIYTECPGPSGDNPI